MKKQEVSKSVQGQHMSNLTKKIHLTFLLKKRANALTKNITQFCCVER